MTKSNDSFFGRLTKRLKGEQPKAAEPPPTPQIEIPTEWLDAAQREVDVTVSRQRVEAARSAEAEADHGVNTTALREAMLNHLSVEQLSGLVETLGFASEQLVGGKGRRVLALMTLAGNTGKMPELLAACEALSADVKWQ